MDKTPIPYWNPALQLVHYMLSSNSYYIISTDSKKIIGIGTYNNYRVLRIRHIRLTK